jgi:hypothetical protein
LNVTFGSSGTTYRPSSPVTTIFVKGVDVSFVSAMTRTPASRPFELSTVPLMNPCGNLGGGGNCACSTASNPTDMNPATPSATAMRGALVNLRGDDAIIDLLLVRITRFRYLIYGL